MASLEQGAGWNRTEVEADLAKAIQGCWKNSGPVGKVFKDLIEKIFFLEDSLCCLQAQNKDREVKIEELTKNLSELSLQVGELRETKVKGLEEGAKANEVIQELKLENEKLKSELEKLKEHACVIKEAQMQVQEEVKVVRESFQEEKLENSKWVEVVKRGGGENKRETISAAIEEQGRRDAKFKNVIVRGLDEGTSPKEDVHGLMVKMGITLPFEAAWRVGKDNTRSKPLIIKFKNLEEKTTFVRKRAALKGTRIFLDEDLTQIQLEHRRKHMEQVMAARREGKWAVYREGRVIIRDRGIA